MTVFHLFSGNRGLHRTSHRWDSICWLVFGILFHCAGNISADTLLVEAGSKTVWKYLDDGSEPAADWREPNYDDTSWKTGRAPFGYGEPEVMTEIGYGENAAHKHIAAYFRHRFTAPDVRDFRELLILLRIDDGAIVYLNGKEILRENLPAGKVTSKTTAQRRINAEEEQLYHRYLVPAAALLPGNNELAVEVHQIDGNSSDLFFDMLVKAYAAGELPQRAQVVPAAREATLTFREKHYLSARTIVPDGYVDGGRGMEVDTGGSVKTGREVMVVDRQRDPELRKHIAYARSEFIAGLPPLSRARFLALYVDVQCSPAEGRHSSLAAAALVESEFREREMLLGRSVGSGICRHRALLFKVLADEAGLDAALARGNLGVDGGHTWNELLLPDGTRLIVDCMNPSGGFDFPKTTHPAAQLYLTVRNEPYYPPSKPGK